MSVIQRPPRPVIRLDDPTGVSSASIDNTPVEMFPQDSAPTSPSRLGEAWRRRFPLRLSVAGKRKAVPRLTPPPDDKLQPARPNASGGSDHSHGYEEWRINPPARKSSYRLSDKERKRLEEGYEWENESVGSAEHADDVVDTYSWVDPDKAGSAFDHTPGVSTLSLSQGAAPSGQTAPRRDADEVLLPEPVRPLNIVVNPSTPIELNAQFPSPPLRPNGTEPETSYNRLIGFQTSSSQGHSSNTHTSTEDTIMSPTTGRPRPRSGPEWHEMVEPALLDSLPREEIRRQGLWWELIKGELEYAADLKTACELFMQPLIDHDPHIIDPESRLAAFSNEVFSTLPHLAQKHQALSDELMRRQREQWPLLDAASDLLLHNFLDMVDLYEVYMKNYPFAEARVRRERQKNKLFAAFLVERQDSMESRRRDLFAFLVRPVTRLPRLLLLLDALMACTPEDHVDHETLPTVHQVLTGTLKGSQPGIESAEAKIKLWNVAERLLFRKGEVIELDIGEPKRSLAHEGYVFRRVRSETNWHGWQDLHAFLLDNYFLLARDEEHGKFVVVSRPIHLDFLHLVSIDAVPERRYDYISPRRRLQPGQEAERTERLMFPMTISTGTGLNGRTYTLCTSTQAARELWKEKIEAAQTLRQFDVENNRLFAIHRLTSPLVRERLTTADSFEWIGRDTIAVATTRSVWLGWKRDSGSFRELVTFPSGLISTISLVPQFGWLLVVSSGRLYVFSLSAMIPTSEPSTWTPLTRDDATLLSPPEHNVALARVGDTKGRILIAYAAHARNSHQTLISLHEPLLPSHSVADQHFRPYASLTIPGYASDIFFFRQTIAVVTERSFIIAEPGNPTTHAIPTFPTSIPAHATVVRLATAAKPLAMYQIAEDEFVLVYDWGACFVNKFGEVCRKGSFFRWNVNPSYCVFRSPHVILFDETQGMAEVRDIMTGRMCELIEEKGLRSIRLARRDQDLQCLSAKGLLQIKETFEL